MFRLLLAALCATVMAGCASSPAPGDDAKNERQDTTKPGPVFSHITIGGG